MLAMQHAWIWTPWIKITLATCKYFAAALRDSRGGISIQEVTHTHNNTLVAALRNSVSWVAPWAGLPSRRW